MFQLVASDKQSIALQCLQIAFIGNKMGQGEGFGSCIEDPPEDILKLRQAASDVLRGFLIQKEEKVEPKKLDQTASSSCSRRTCKRDRAVNGESIRYFLDNCGNMLSEMGFMFANNAGVPKDEFFAIIAARSVEPHKREHEPGVVSAARERGA